MNLLLQRHGCRNALRITDHETGEIVCSKCGVVLGYSAEHKTKRKTQEWSGSRSSLRFSDMGVSGKIGSKNYDYSGKKIPTHSQSRIKRLKMLDSRTKTGSTSNRNLNAGLILVDMFSEKISIGKVATEKAAYFFRKAHELGLSKGRSIREMAAACVYISCRFYEIPRSLTEISKVSHVHRTTIAKMYRAIHEQINIKSDPHNPKSFVSKIATSLGIDEKTRRKAIRLLQDDKKQHLLTGKRPSALATSALYVACKQSNRNVSLRKFAFVSKNSVNTIRKLSKILEN